MKAPSFTHRVLTSFLFLFCLMAFINPVANATVSSTVRKVSYACTGAATTFSITFPYISATDINVYKDDVLVTTGYSVSTYTNKVTYPTSGTPCALGSTLTLVRNTPLTNTLTLSLQGPLAASSINTEFDKLTMISHQLQEQLDRAPKFAVSSDTTAPVIPEPQTGYSLIWGSDGNFVNSDLRGEKGDKGDTGAAGPAGPGSGDVLGPATNSDGTIPVWNGTDTRTLSNGWTIGTSAYNIVQVGADGKLPALDGSNLTNVPISVSSISGSALTSLGSISAGAGSIPAANITSLPDSSLANITTAGKVSGSALTSLSSVPFAAGKIPLANLNTITVPFGGTGITSKTAYGIMSSGATTVDALSVISPSSTVGYVLTSNGSSAFPSFQQDIDVVSSGYNYTNSKTTSTEISSGLKIAFGYTGEMGGGDEWVVTNLPFSSSSSYSASMSQASGTTPCSTAITTTSGSSLTLKNNMSGSCTASFRWIAIGD